MGHDDMGHDDIMIQINPPWTKITSQCEFTEKNYGTSFKIEKYGPLPHGAPMSSKSESSSMIRHLIIHIEINKDYMLNQTIQTLDTCMLIYFQKASQTSDTFFLTHTHLDTCTDVMSNGKKTKHLEAWVFIFSPFFDEGLR